MLYNTKWAQHFLPETPLIPIHILAKIPHHAKNIWQFYAAKPPSTTKYSSGNNKAFLQRNK